MLMRRHFVLIPSFNCLMYQNPPKEILEHMFFLCAFNKTMINLMVLIWYSIVIFFRVQTRSNIT
jgi:hypothetical protein